MGFFFFFQAEDGIRDLTVTGVQTCALPIWLASSSPVGLCPPRSDRAPAPPVTKATSTGRSEERRVGKECRSRWWRYHQKKKKLRISRKRVEGHFVRAQSALRRGRSCR